MTKLSLDLKRLNPEVFTYEKMKSLITSMAALAIVGFVSINMMHDIPRMTQSMIGGVGTGLLHAGRAIPLHNVVQAGVGGLTSGLSASTGAGGIATTVEQLGKNTFGRAAVGGSKAIDRMKEQIFRK